MTSQRLITNLVSQVYLPERAFRRSNEPGQQKPKTKGFCFAVLLVCFLVLLDLTSEAQTVSSGSASSSLTAQTEDPLTWLKQLASEVRKLKTEVQQLQLEAQAGKIAQLERQLQQVQTSKQELVAQESELRGELAALDDSLNQPSLPAEERVMLETLKAELVRNRPEQLRLQQQTLLDQEVEISKQLEQEQQRWRQLMEEIRKLASRIEENKTRWESSARTPRLQQ